MKKRVSLKMFFTVLWRGVCQLFRPISELLGIKDGCAYTRKVWRFAQGVFGTFVLILCMALLWSFCKDGVYREWIRPYTSDRVYNCKYLSSRIEHQMYFYNESGRIYDKVQKKVILDKVDWVATSNDNDSLAVFARKGKRGYLNRFTGEVVIPAIYSRAWVFCEGLAAVERDGELVFIDHAGQVVIDKDFEVVGEEPIYAFNDGYCEVKNPIDEKVGLIDRQGNWALLPEYDIIWHEYGMWRVCDGESEGLFTSEMDTLFSVDKDFIQINEDAIEVHFKNYVVKRYDYEGTILNDLVIDEVLHMRYPILELHSCVSDGEYVEKMKYAVADCQLYGSYNHYGLMDRNGRILTPPDYDWIEAIAKDLYLCHPHGYIINGKGELVE